MALGSTTIGKSFQNSYPAGVEVQSEEEANQIDR